MAMRSIIIAILLAGPALGSGAHAKKQPAPGPDEVFIPATTTQIGIDAKHVHGYQALFRINNPMLFVDLQPRHKVHVDAFYMDKYLVTNAQFKAFVEAMPRFAPDRQQDPAHSDYLNHWIDGEPPPDRADHPVVNVTWSSAAAYCAWKQKTLPSEEQWEVAARAGHKETLYPWGPEPPDAGRANYAAAGLATTTKVGSYPANDYGLYDMAGNVWQFTGDAWRRYGDEGLIASDVSIIPTCCFCVDEEGKVPPQKPLRVTIRGGSYGAAPINMWVEYRDSHPANSPKPFVGFRCARPAKKR